MPVDQISKHDQELKIIKDWLTKQPHLPSNVGKYLQIKSIDQDITR